MPPEVEAMEAMLRRLDTVERNASDLARSHTELTNMVGRVDNRVDALETSWQDERVDKAARVERDIAIKNDIASVKSDVASIKATFAKALWVFISAVIVAFATFLIRGGMAP